MPVSASQPVSETVGYEGELEMKEESPSYYEALSHHHFSESTLILAHDLLLQNVVYLKSPLGPAKRLLWPLPRQRLQ